MWEEPSLVRRHIKRIQGDTFSARIRILSSSLFLLQRKRKKNIPPPPAIETLQVPEAGDIQLDSLKRSG